MLYKEVCGCHAILFVDPAVGRLELLNAAGLIGYTDAICIITKGLDYSTKFFISRKIYECVTTARVHSLFDDCSSFSNAESFRWVLAVLKESEEKGHTVIYDKELYDLIKCLIAMKAMD